MPNETEIRYKVYEKLQKALNEICGELNDEYPDLTFYVHNNDTLMLDQSDISSRDTKIYKI